ncbi:helix-turn-helix domain-containing protein [Gimesia maris]
MCKLHQSGMSIRKIASALQVGRRTVRRYLRPDSFPERAKRSGTNCLNPYLNELQSMWDAGVTRATDLWRRLKDQGFPGSYSVVSRKVALWRKKQQISGNCQSMLNNVRSVPLPSSRHLSWLLWKPIDKLKRKLVKELLRAQKIFQTPQLIREFQALI